MLNLFPFQNKLKIVENTTTTKTKKNKKKTSMAEAMGLFRDP